MLYCTTTDVFNTVGTSLAIALSAGALITAFIAYRRDYQGLTAPANVDITPGGDHMTFFAHSGGVWILHVTAKIKIANRGGRKAVVHNLGELEVDATSLGLEKIYIGREYPTIMYLGKPVEPKDTAEVTFQPWEARVYTYTFAVPLDLIQEPVTTKGFEATVRHLAGQSHASICISFMADYYAAADNPTEDHQVCDPYEASIQLDPSWRTQLRDQFGAVPENSDLYKRISSFL